MSWGTLLADKLNHVSWPCLGLCQLCGGKSIHQVVGLQPKHLQRLSGQISLSALLGLPFSWRQDDIFLHPQVWPTDLEDSVQCLGFPKCVIPRIFKQKSKNSTKLKTKEGKGATVIYRNPRSCRIWQKLCEIAHTKRSKKSAHTQKLPN